MLVLNAAVGGAAAESGSGPVMRHRLRDCFAFWESIGVGFGLASWLGSVNLVLVGRIIQAQPALL